MTLRQISVPSPGPGATPLAEEMRLLMRQQATTVTVVAVPGEPPTGFTATSFTSVSLQPALVSFCVSGSSSCWEAIEAAENVVVNFLEERQEDIARIFSASGIDRFSVFRRWRRSTHGAALIDGTLGALECAIVERVSCGSQMIVIAEPTVVHVNDGRPLVHHQGGYGSYRPHPASARSG